MTRTDTPTTSSDDGWRRHFPGIGTWVCPICDGPRPRERKGETAFVHCGSCKTEFGEAEWLTPGISPIPAPTISAAGGEDDAAFVERMRLSSWAIISAREAERLLALARRGAQSSQPVGEPAHGLLRCWEWRPVGLDWLGFERQERFARDCAGRDGEVRPLYTAPAPAPAPSAAPGEVSEAEVEAGALALTKQRHGMECCEARPIYRKEVRAVLEAAAKVRPQAARGDGADVLAERQAIIARLERARQLAAHEEHNHLGAEGEHRWGLVKTVLRDEIAAIRARSAPQPSHAPNIINGASS